MTTVVHRIAECNNIAARIPREAVTSRLHIPTIGIGAGPHCDGQVLVSYDILGLFDTFVPPFAKQYARLGDTILLAIKNYADDVRNCAYPQSNSQLCQLNTTRIIQKVAKPQQN